MKKLKKMTVIFLCICLSASLYKTVRVSADNYEYDRLGRVTRVIYNDGSGVRYEYDAAGNIKEIKVDENETKEPEPAPEDIEAEKKEIKEKVAQLQYQLQLIYNATVLLQNSSLPNSEWIVQQLTKEYKRIEREIYEYVAEYMKLSEEN